MKKIEETIQQLKSSPLFYLFVSSRELFHSNFWYWLSTLNPKETAKLFSTDNNLPKDIKFIREHNQRNDKDKSKIDLYITDSQDTNIVIENKVKDFPKVEQLDRIKKTFTNLNSQFVLVTLFHCNDITFDGWKMITYKEISEKINPENFTIDKYHQSLIQDYIYLTRNLSKLTELLDLSPNYDFAISHNKDLYKKLNEIKLWEGYQKLRASHLITKYQESNEVEMYVGYGINNQKATIDFVLGLEDNYRIGIQLEDNQFRKFVAGKKHIEFAESLRKNNIFFNSNWISPREKKC